MGTTITRMSRRHVLKGAAATTLGLPLLEAMLDRNGEAYADGTPLARRLIVFHCPTALRSSPSRETDGEGLTPTRTGFGYDLRSCLQPLAELGLQRDVSAVSGLFAPPFDAPGGYKSDYHGFAMRSVLTGVRHGFSGYYAEPKGVSVDQVVAEALGAATPFRSLVYQIDPNRDLGLSIQRRATGGFSIVHAQTSPAQAYRTLLTNLPSGQPDPAGSLERRLRLSSLSFARDGIAGLAGRLGASDRQKLEQHLEHVRALEKRLLATATSPGGCRALAFPAADPPNVGVEPDQERRADLFIELIALAVTCQLTHSIFLAGTDRLSRTGMLHELWRNRGGLHAAVQHSAPQAELDRANRWFVGKYARLLASLKAIREGTGTALDTSAAIFVMEGGKAGRAADGGRDPNHSTDNMCMLVAGRAGGLRPGQHVVARDRHPAAVFNTALRALGISRQMGDIADHVPQLFVGP